VIERALSYRASNGVTFLTPSHGRCGFASRNQTSHRYAHRVAFANSRSPKLPPSAGDPLKTATALRSRATGRLFQLPVPDREFAADRRIPRGVGNLRVLQDMRCQRGFRGGCATFGMVPIHPVRDSADEKIGHLQQFRCHGIAKLKTPIWPVAFIAVLLDAAIENGAKINHRLRNRAAVWIDMKKKRVDATAFHRDLVNFLGKANLPATLVEKAMLLLGRINYQAVKLRSCGSEERINHALIRGKFRARDFAPFEFTSREFRLASLPYFIDERLRCRRSHRDRTQNEIAMAILAALVNVEVAQIGWVWRLPSHG
jgi:hypothetical protein